MKLLAYPTSFSEAIAWLTTLNRLLGLRIFEYPRDHPRPVLSLIYFSVLYILYCICIITFQSYYYVDEELLKLEYVMYQLLMYITVMTMLPKVVLGWWYSKTFNSCCKKISEIDETLRQLGSAIKYNKEYLITVGMVSCWFLGSFCVCTVVYLFLESNIYLNTSSSLYLIVSYIYGMTIDSIIIFEFYMFVRCLQIRFKLVNQLLCLIGPSTKVTNWNCFKMQKNATRCNNETPRNAEQQKHISSLKLLSQLRQQLRFRNNFVTNKKKDCQIQLHLPFQLEKQFEEELRNQTQNHGSRMMENQEHKHRLQTIKQVHLELCKVSKTLCTIFGVQIACEMGISIMLITGTCFNLYVRIFLQSKVRGLMYQVIIAIAISLINLLKFIPLSYVCNDTADEGNKAAEIVHTIYGYIVNPDIQEETQQFGIQILQSPVAFTAFGISLGNSVLTSCLRAVTTYLVIMIQMSNSLESNNAVQYAKYI